MTQYYSKLSNGAITVAYPGKLVGIGTTNPSTKLQVSGTSQFDGNLNVANSTLSITAAAPNMLFTVPSGGLDSRIFNDGSGNFIIGHGDNSNTPTERLRIDSSGNVGIGTDDPNQKLEVFGNQRISNNGVLEFFGGTIYPQISRNGTSGGLIIDTAGGGVSNSVPLLSVRENGGTDFVTVLGSGNVGIGTLSPNEKLTVSGNISASGVIYADLTSSTSSSVVVESSGVLKKRTADSSAFDGAAKDIRPTDPAGADLDTANDALYVNYTATNCWTNTPLSMYGYIWSQTDNSNGFQLAFNNRHGSTDYGDIYFRTKNTSGFSNWRKLYHPGNLTLSTLGGVDGSGTDGTIPIWSGSSTTLSDSVITQNNGNIGIGVASPSNKLEVQQLASDQSGAAAIKVIGTAYGTNKTIHACMGTTSNTKSLFYAENSNGVIMNIAGDGNVGIGTDDPSTLLTLHQASDTNIGGLRIENSDNSSAFRVWKQPGGSGASVLVDNGVDTMFIKNGDIGIGTDDPIAKFEVTDGSSSITLQEYSSGAAIFLDGVDGDFTGGDYFHILANSNSYLGLGGYAGGTTPLNIDNSGNVGIGTTNPGHTLHVDGNIHQDSGHSIYSHGNVGWHRQGYDIGGPGVANGATITLNPIHGETADPGYHYKIYLTTTGTGTDSGATYLGIYDADATSWTLRPVSRAAITSNHPLLSASGSNFIAYHSHSSTSYDIHARVETLYKADTDGTGHSLGADFHWQRTGNSLTYHDGDVGIGTATASSRLHVYDIAQLNSAGFCSIARIQAAYQSSNSNHGIGFAINNNDPSAGIYVTEDGGSGAELLFATSTDYDGPPTLAERMRIDSGGNVGIGTTDPNYKLDVNAGLSAGGGIAYPVRVGHGTMATAGDGVGILFNRGSAEQYNGYVRIQSTESNPDYLNPRLEFGIQDTDSFNLADASTRMVITGDGNVGINTTNPGVKLDVSGSGARIGGNFTTSTLYIQATDTTGSPAATNRIIMQGYEGRAQGIFYENTTYTGEEWFSGITYNDNFNSWQVGYDASTGCAEYQAKSILTVKDSGNVGIGTTSPSGNLEIWEGTANAAASLKLTGNPAVSAHTEYANIIFHSRDAATGANAGEAQIRAYRGGDRDAPYLNFDLADTVGVLQRVMTINGQCNAVGIGTTAPNAKLEVKSDGGSATGAEIRLQHANNNSTDVVSTVNFANNVGSVAMIQGGTTGANNTGYISFFTSNAGVSSEKVRIIGDGNVGIGTDEPSQKLEIAGNVRVMPTSGDAFIRLTDIGTRNWDLKVPDGLDYFEIDGTTSTSLVITGAGDVGIGTADPDAKLEVLGEAIIGSAATKLKTYSDASYSGIFNGSSLGSDEAIYFGSGHTYFITDGTASMTIDSNRNIGIGSGTGNPQYKLDIGGDTPSTSNTIRLLQSDGGTAIRVGPGGGDNDITLLRVDGTSSNNHGETDSSNAGFSLKYMGSRDSADNSLSIFTDNVTETNQIEAVTFRNDGTVGIGTTTSDLGVTIQSSCAGSTTTGTLTLKNSASQIGHSFVTSYFAPASASAGNSYVIKNPVNSTNSVTLGANNSLGGYVNLKDAAGVSEVFISAVPFVTTVFNDGGQDTDFRVESLSGVTSKVADKEYALFVDASAGAVGIGTSQPSYALEVDGTAHVNGTFTADTKSFLIDHPTKEGYMLRYGCLEGPEHAVYVRGTGTTNKIILPDYWSGLIDEDTITVTLTPKGKFIPLFVEDTNDTEITVGGLEVGDVYDYVIFAERRDVDPLEVEFLRPVQGQ